MSEELIHHRVKFRCLFDTAKVPQSWSDDAVGIDLHAHLISDTGRENTTMIPSCATRNIGTGLAAEPPPGYFLACCSRSGLGSKSLFVANAPGIIDPDYRGEIKVLFYNGSLTTHYVKHGDRIAQLVLFPFSRIYVDVVEELSKTLRGEAGLGSTGT